MYYKLTYISTLDKGVLMKGCLSFIIKTVIAVLVFFGLLHLGVIDFIKDKIQEHLNDTSKQEKMIDKAKDVLDLSQIEEEYSIDKNLKLLGNRMIVAEHDATNQKMIMIEPKNETLLTKEDIKSEDIQAKIDALVEKYQYKLVKFEKVEVKKSGQMYFLNQTVPYVKVVAQISNLPIKDLEGVVGVAELENGKNLIVMSVNEKEKYSQIITDGFYKKVK